MSIKVANDSIKFGIGCSTDYIETGWSEYVYRRFKEKKLIRNNRNAPVEFSETDHFIRLFIDGQWITINGFSKDDYEREIKPKKYIYTFSYNDYDNKIQTASIEADCYDEANENIRLDTEGYFKSYEIVEIKRND